MPESLGRSHISAAHTDGGHRHGARRRPRRAPRGARLTRPPTPVASAHDGNRPGRRANAPGAGTGARTPMHGKRTLAPPPPGSREPPSPAHRAGRAAHRSSPGLRRPPGTARRAAASPARDAPSGRCAGGRGARGARGRRRLGDGARALFRGALHGPAVTHGAFAIGSVRARPPAARRSPMGLRRARGHPRARRRDRPDRARPRRRGHGGARPLRAARAPGADRRPQPSRQDAVRGTMGAALRPAMRSRTGSGTSCAGAANSASRTSIASRRCSSHAAAGTSHVRSHTDIDPGVRHEGGRGGPRRRRAARRTHRRQPGRVPAARAPDQPRHRRTPRGGLSSGVETVGGIDPAGIDGDPVRHLDLLFDLAARHGAGIDLHLHDPGTLGAWELGLIAERTRDARAGRPGHGEPRLRVLPGRRRDQAA